MSPREAGSQFSNSIESHKTNWNRNRLTAAMMCVNYETCFEWAKKREVDYDTRIFLG